MSPTGIKFRSTRLIMYVSAADWLSSLNNKGLKPASSRPSERPPQPAKRSIQVSSCLGFIIVQQSESFLTKFVQVDLFWFSVNWKKPWVELRNGRVGFDG